MKALLTFWIPVIVTAAVLLSARFLSKQTGYDPAADAYFEASRRAAEAIPYTLPGGWIGRDVPVPTQATDMLKPNVLVSRSYESISQSGAVSLLVVQTTDVANLLNHYPPACYPGRGWSILGNEPSDWQAAGLDINGTTYRMLPPGGDEDRPVHIYNFMAHADGKTSRDMQGLTDFARQGTGRAFGGGQVQVLFFGDMTEDERDELFELVVAACEPTLQAILDGM